MSTYLQCWTRVAADLFQQALAGEPGLSKSEPRPVEAGAFAFTAVLSGDETGRFCVLLDRTIFESPLLGEGVEQRSGWNELLRETFEAACGEMLAKTGMKCRVERVEETNEDQGVMHGFQLRAGEHSWTLAVCDDVHAQETEKSLREEQAAEPPAHDRKPAVLSAGLELLLDVELEASLRFGCREMPLGEILDLGPGDVVQLDRHVSDPVDLIVGDKIVARGEVVLVNGNFGLRVSEVAAPRKRLESIRCLF